MAIRRIVHPTKDPIELSEAKLHARIEIESDDALVVSYIKAATSHVEQFLRYGLLTQTYRYTMDRFGHIRGQISLPYAYMLQGTPVVKYYDVSGQQQTFGATNYYVDAESSPARIALKSGNQWPDLEHERINAVQIEYVVGYQAAKDIPDDIKLAIKQFVAYAYAQREPVVAGYSVAMEMPHTCFNLLWPYRMLEFY